MGSWRNANIEAIAALKPDLVVAYERNPGQELEKKLGPLGIQVLRMDFYKMKSMAREIRDMGRILGKEKEAEAVCSWNERNMNLIRTRLKNVSAKPTVYVESYTDYHTVGPGTGGDEMCSIAGGMNIASAMSIPYPEVTAEWVLSKNPDVIVKAAAWSNGYEKNGSEYLNMIRTRIVNRPLAGRIKAVKDGRVMVLDSNIWTGPRAVVGICYLARLFHPSLFRDIDPSAIHREYDERFLRLPFKGNYVSNISRETP
jgi:iron complex transport system substrate-binding protein